MHEVLLGLFYIFTSFVGSMLAFFIWVHLDLEGYWQARKVRHGKKLEETATRDKQIKHRESRR